MSSAHPQPDLDTLVSLFYEAPDELGQFEQVEAVDLPPIYHWLLAHNHHMTVVVERFHDCLVDVRVLKFRLEGTLYARKILLLRQADQHVVQFGIMRVNFAYLADEVRRDIESQSLPLGRVLIQHNVLREVRLCHLWKVTPGNDLQDLFGLSKATTTYGRTAVIDCNGEPAIEVLEIVTPIESPPWARQAKASRIGIRSRRRPASGGIVGP